jgi:hypothetical protein
MTFGTGCMRPLWVHNVKLVYHYSPGLRKCGYSYAACTSCTCMSYLLLLSAKKTRIGSTRDIVHEWRRSFATRVPAVGAVVTLSQCFDCSCVSFRTRPLYDGEIGYRLKFVLSQIFGCIISEEQNSSET